MPGSIQGSGDGEKLGPMPSFEEGSGLWLLLHLQSLGKIRTSFASVASLPLPITPLTSFSSFLSPPQLHTFHTLLQVTSASLCPPIPLQPTVCSAITASLMALKQQFPIFLAPGTDFLEDSFSMDWGLGGGLAMIQVHYTSVVYVISNLVLPLI